MNAANLALLASAIPLYQTLTSVVVAVGYQGKVMPHPTPIELESAKSIHALAFTSHQKLLLVESEGDFDIEVWEHVAEMGRRLCCGAPRLSGEARHEKTAD